MNTDLIRPELTVSGDVELFAFYYIDDMFDLAEFSSVVPLREALFANCPDLLKEATDLLDERLYSLLSKIHYLDFVDFVDNRFKARLLVANSRISICNVGDYLDTRLKHLGEENVLRTLCTEEFMSGNLAFN